MKSRWIGFIAIISLILIAAACGGGGNGSGGSVHMYVTNAGSASISGFNLSSGGSVGSLERLTIHSGQYAHFRRGCAGELSAVNKCRR